MLIQEGRVRRRIDALNQSWNQSQSQDQNRSQNQNQIQARLSNTLPLDFISPRSSSLRGQRVKGVKEEVVGRVMERGTQTGSSLDFSLEGGEGEGGGGNKEETSNESKVSEFSSSTWTRLKNKRTC